MKDYQRVKCEICGEEAHFIEAHLKSAHPEMTIDDYAAKYPSSPIMSKIGEERRKELISQNQQSPIIGSIKRLFGCSPFGSVDDIMMFSAPHNTTPKIDDAYHFDKKLLASCLYAIVNRNNPVLLTGPTGSGKSSIITQIAARLNRPFFRINCDTDVTRADFVGQWVLRGKDMVFQYGILPIAMKTGAIQIVDEWDTANPGVAMTLQAVLEDDGKLTIAETGEIIEPHENFRLFCTANTLGMGDETGLYNGTQPQNFAQLDRFKIVEHVTYPSASVEQSIIKSKTGIDDSDILNKLTEFARLVREAFIKEEIRVTMSTRTIINVAEKIVDFGDVGTAYRMSYVNKCSGEDKKFVGECLQRVWAIRA